MSKPDPRIVRAAQLQHAKDYHAAQQIYLEILKAEPDHPDALFLLGLLLHQTGQHEHAIIQLRKAITARPNQADFCQTLVDALRGANRLPEATAEAKALIQLQPRSASHYLTVGHLLLQRGDEQAALPYARQAIALAPNNASAYRLLSIIQNRLNQPENALAALEKAIAIAPTYVDAIIDKGVILQSLGSIPQAIEAYLAGLRLAPQNDVAQNNLGTCYILSERPQDALRCFQIAAQLRPNIPEHGNNIGAALLDLGRLDDAIAAFETTCRLHPSYADASNNLGNCYSTIGEPEKATAAYRQAITIRPSFSGAHSNLLMCLLYPPDSDERLIYSEHLAFDKQHGERLQQEIQPHENDFTANRKLRIGYVSPDFREHSVRYFIEPILASHNHEQFEIYCYASGPRKDEVTDRLRTYVSAWHDVAGLNDSALANLIRSHQIDILIDLAGHTSDNRMLAFARKPAPVQVTYLGYPTTTGLKTIDYRLTDTITDRPGTSEDLHYEELVHLPGPFFVFDEDRNIPYDPRLPADTNGYVTFGSFNNFSKISPQALNAWAKILLGVPNSHVLMKAKALANASTRRYVEQFFVSQGITAERVDLRAWVPLSQHMQLLGRVDLTLDTFPYNGHTTSCQSLWMGAPFITIAGNSFRSRVGATILHHLQLPDLIAANEDTYVSSAVALASDLARLRELRSTLRERMLASPLSQAKIFTAGLEKIYLQMWRRACN